MMRQTAARAIDDSAAARLRGRGSPRVMCCAVRGGFRHGFTWSVAATFSLLAVFVPLMGGVVFATAPEARYLAASAVKEIRYERSGCYGWCPAYSLTFGADGQARYDGAAYVRERGIFETTFEPRRFARFADALYHRGFFTARTSGVYIADAPTTTVAVAFNDGTTVTTKGYVDVLAGDLGDDLYAAGYFIDGFAVNVCGWHRVARPAGPALPGPFAPISTAACRTRLAR